MSMEGWRRAELERQRREQLRLQQVTAQAQAMLAACQQGLSTISDPAVQQFAQASLREVVSRLNAATKLIAVNPDAALGELLGVQGRLTQAVAAAEQAAHRWSTEQVQTRARLAEARARVDAGRSVEGAAVSALQERVVRAESLHAAGKHGAAAKLLEGIETDVEQAVATALNERARREIVGALLSTLQTMGFVVEAPQLVADERTGSMVVLTGRLPSGRMARFEIQLDGQLRFDLDGYEGRSCAKEMAGIEEKLRERFRVKLGPPQVNWKNPDRISSTARPLPIGAQHRNL
jgi:hypothetical protein